MKQYKINIPESYCVRLEAGEVIKMQCNNGDTYVNILPEDIQNHGIACEDHSRWPQSWLEEIKEEIDWDKVKDKAIVELADGHIGTAKDFRNHVGVKPASQIPLATWKELFCEVE